MARSAEETEPSACSAMTMPAPESRSTPAASMSSAVEVSAVRICAGVSALLNDSNSPAIAPA
jgi:hypothetical protein